MVWGLGSFGCRNSAAMGICKWQVRVMSGALWDTDYDTGPYNHFSTTLKRVLARLGRKP